MPNDKIENRAKPGRVLAKYAWALRMLCGVENGKLTAAMNQRVTAQSKRRE